MNKITLLMIMFLCLFACQSKQVSQASIDDMCQPSSNTITDNENEIRNFAAKATEAALNATPNSPPPYFYYTQQAWDNFYENHVTNKASGPKASISYSGNIVITKECLVNHQHGWIVILPVRLQIETILQYLIIKQLIVKNNNELKVVRTELSFDTPKMVNGV